MQTKIREDIINTEELHLSLLTETYRRCGKKLAWCMSQKNYETQPVLHFNKGWSVSVCQAIRLKRNVHIQAPSGQSACTELWLAVGMLEGFPDLGTATRPTSTPTHWISFCRKDSFLTVSQTEVWFLGKIFVQIIWHCGSSSLPLAHGCCCHQGIWTASL